MDDWQLIQQYVQTGSEPAFAELVRRHIDWVYSVALRQVGHSQLAEDVVQSVFALLARKAGALRPGTVPAGWLFRTTCFVAKCSLRTERRRKSREETASAMMTTIPADSSEFSWDLVAPHLDQAVASLSETDRSAILLRFYQRKSLSEIAQHLGISDEAAKKRVSRSVEKLRDFFTRRSLSLGAAALATALLEKTVQAAPLSLKVSAVKASSAAAAALPQLARDALTAWHWAKIKLAAAATLSVVLLASLVHTVASTKSSQSVARNTQTARNSSMVQPASSTAKKDQATNSKAARETAKFLFRAVSAETGKGIAAARVRRNYVADGEWFSGDELHTAADGTCAIPLPEGKLDRLDVGILKDGFVQKFYTWRTDYGEPLPLNYILKLERAVSIGGQVQDSAGNPVSGAEIALEFAGTGDASFREPQRERLGFLNIVSAVKTDAQGRWSCALTPSDYSDFTIVVRHSDFVEGNFTPESGPSSSNGPHHLPIEDLWATKAVLRLESGFQLTGLVLDDAGNPIADARVTWMGELNYRQDGVKTKSDGSFQLPGLPPGIARISAWTKHFAPSLAFVEISAATPQVVFRLDHGWTVPLRIVDEDGAGIASAWATVDLPMAHNADFHVTSGPDGRAVLEGIPTNVVKNLNFHAGGPGYFYSRNIRLNSSDPEPTIQLVKALRVSGNVLDADTHEPVSDFKAIPCNGDSTSGYDRLGTKRGQWGSYAAAFTESGAPFRVRIEAEDYEPAMSPPMGARPSEQVQDFLLHKKDLGRAIRGTVLLPNGQPAANIRVALLTFEQGATLFHGTFDKRLGLLTSTAADGTFKFDADPQAHTLVAADPANGFARLRLHLASQSFTLQLQPWGRIEGRVILSGNPAPDQQVVITGGFPAYRSVSEGLYAGFDFLKTDAQGKFACDLVPPGDFTLYINHGTGQSLSHQTSADVRAGETTQVQIGGNGRHVVGKLSLSGGTNVDWAAQVISAFLSTNIKKPAGQPPAESKDFAARLKLIEFFDDSQEWRAYERACGSFPLQVASDGFFSAEDISPGPYQLNLTLAESPWSAKDSPDLTAGFRRNIIASLREDVVIPDEPNNSTPVDLGTFTAKLGVSARR